MLSMGLLTKRQTIDAAAMMLSKCEALAKRHIIAKVHVRHLANEAWREGVLPRHKRGKVSKMLATRRHTAQEALAALDTLLWEILL